MRDESGEFIAGGAGKPRHVRRALHAETEACVKAFEGAMNLGVHRVIFQADCQTMVKALKTKEYEAADIGVLLWEARSLCRMSFEDADFMFCRGECNSVVHALAQHGLGAPVPFSVWAEPAPHFVSGMVSSDRAGHHV